MLNKRITNLYQGLSNKEKALLSFETVGANSQEFSRIRNSVKSELAEVKEYEYRSWILKCDIFTTAWSMLFFKTHERYLEAMMAFMANEADSTTTEEQKSNVLIYIQQQKACLFAIDNVLEALCDKYSLNPDVVRKYADIKLFTAIGEALPDIEYQNQLIEMFDQEIFSYTPTH